VVERDRARFHQHAFATVNHTTYVALNVSFFASTASTARPYGMPGRIRQRHTYEPARSTEAGTSTKSGVLVLKYAATKCSEAPRVVVARATAVALRVTQAASMVTRSGIVLCGPAPEGRTTGVGCELRVVGCDAERGAAA